MTKLAGYWSMTKPRAMLVVLVTAAAGYFVAMGAGADPWVLLHLVCGVGLAGGGSIVLNQVLEREHDRRMERTKDRPLPTGLISPRAGLAYGVCLSIAGTVWLALGTNVLTASLGALCVLSYVLAYTPLKRVTTLNTAVGAVPGAIPPMMGFTAATGTVGVEAWTLFLILFIWQFPHFLAIGWLYRDDYRRAGYAMLPVLDRDGRMTGRQVVLHAACLIVVSLLPALLGFAGMAYAAVAVVTGTGLLGLGCVFLRLRTRQAAWMLLKGSVVHISLLMGFLVMDRL